jgi:osmotically-inducible protein OsmY
MKTNANLQHDVIQELDWEPSVDVGHVGVIAKEGIVTLTGHVPVYAEKIAAEEAAKRVHGVKAIANEIEVRPSEVHTRDDEDLAAAAVHGLEWDAKVPEDRVTVTVREGWLTLEGTVDWQHQKAAVDRVVRHMSGVRGVTNSIQVQPGAHPHDSHQEAKQRIEHALQRSAVLNRRQVAVEVETEQRMVTLCGDVRSPAERDEAERIAWAVGGVRRVENCITITPWGTGPCEEWGY